METLELLGVALGLATLAGINLYLTVFVTGLAVRLGWITLAPQYEQLSVLADPVILWVSGTLFFLEFFADKVPWVDSLWDSIHTLIRPIGGALLAITVLGEVNPVYDVIVGLLGGGVALSAHAAKAGTRLLINASPEPFTNIGASVAGDVGVVAGLGLIALNPLVALAIAIVVLGLAIWLVPRIFRTARTALWLFWHRVIHAFGRETTPDLAPEIPHELDMALMQARGEDVRVLWAAPCISGKLPDLRPNRFGWLVWTGGEKGGLDFSTISPTGVKLVPISTENCKAQHRAGLFADRVVIYRASDGIAQTFRFDRTRRNLAKQLVERLRQAEIAPAAPALAS